MLRQHQRHAEGGGRGQCKRHPGSDTAPLAGSAQAGRGAQHIQGQGQPQQDHRHGPQQRPRRPLPVHHPSPQSRPQRVGVEGQQGQRHRQSRHRRIQAQTLHTDQQTDHRQHAPVPPTEGNAHALHRQQCEHDTCRHTTAKHHGCGYIHTVVEGNTCRHMVSAHHECDQQQRGKRGATEGSGGGHPAAGSSADSRSSSRST